MLYQKNRMPCRAVATTGVWYAKRRRASALAGCGHMGWPAAGGAPRAKDVWVSRELSPSRLFLLAFGPSGDRVRVRSCNRTRHRVCESLDLWDRQRATTTINECSWVVGANAIVAASLDANCKITSDDVICGLELINLVLAAA